MTAGAVPGIGESRSHHSDMIQVHHLTKTYEDPDGGVRLPSMRADQEFFVQQGYQERPIDLDAAVDLQYVQYAHQVLGPY